MTQFIFAIVLTFLSYSFAFDDVVVKSESMVKKLEKAPVAYYGSLITSNVYSKDKLPWVLFDKDYPDVYKSFMEWSELKTARMQRDLADAPEILRKTFELRSQKESNGFYLIHNIIRVDKVYDKATKTWVNPPPEKSKKVFTQFAYAGPDILRDSSSFKLVQRVISIPDLNSEITNKRIFFLDGMSESVAFLDTPNLENVQFFPYRLYYSVEPNQAIEVRKRIESLVYAGDYAAAAHLADSADLSPRSNAVLKYLNRDYEFILNKDSVSNHLVLQSIYRYEDGLDLLLIRTAERDYRENFKCEELQDKPEVNKDLACPVVEAIALGKMFKPLINGESNFSFGMGADFGIPFLVDDFPDYKSYFLFDVAFDVRIYDVVIIFFKAKYFESVAFANLGAAFYVDYLFPSLEGKKLPEGDPLAGRFAIRLKAGFDNMKASKYGHSNGISPYISLGFRLRGEVVEIWNANDFAKFDIQD